MPKQKKPLSPVAAKETSLDIFGFRDLFTQTKVIIGKHLVHTEDQFSWFQSFLSEAKVNIESIGKNSDSDLSQLNGTTDVGSKDGDPAISSKQSDVHKKKRKKKSSNFSKSLSSGKVTPVNTTQNSSDDVDFHNDKENIDQNNSLQIERDASQSTCNSISVVKLNGEARPNHKTSGDVKIKNSVISEPLATVADSPELNKSPAMDIHNCTYTTKLNDEVQEGCGVSSDAKLKNSIVVLQRLTDVELQESNQCTVSSNDSDHTSVKKLSNKIQVEGNRTFCDPKLDDSIILVEQLEVKPHANKLGECPKVSSGRISGKRMLSQEIRKSSQLLLESASRMSETRRRSSLMRVKIRSSQELLMVTENVEPVNKKPKLSNSEKSFSSDDNKVSKPHSSDSDRGIGSSGSSAGSGSQRSNTSTCSIYAKESLTATKNLLLQSAKSNGQLNRKRSYESMGYKTPESDILKKDFNTSTLRLQNYKPALFSQSRTTPKSAYVFSSSKTNSHISRSKLLNGSYSTKPCTPLHGGNTTLLKSQEEKRQQEKEQACVKKQQMLKMKVEEQKRKREERMQKNLEARQQLEREKAERHKFIEQKEKKHSNIAKEKEKLKEIKKNRLKNDSLDGGGTMKKLYSVKTADKVNTPIDSTKMHNREPLSSKPVICVTKHLTSTEAGKSSEKKTLKPSESQPAALNSTFVKNEEGPSESYEMTPYRPRSTYCNYDITDLKSDDESEDECQPTKPVPEWAVGMRFKQALINQHYHPPNVEGLFGSISVPDLSEMFTQKKARYLRRTSSAIWNTPDRVIFGVKSYS